MQSVTEDSELTNNFSNSTKVENFEMYNDEIGQPHQDEINCTRKWNILHMLSGIYAEFLVIIAVTAVFTEILHGPVPLFHIHVYFYFYLLVLSIIIFIVNFVSKLRQKNSDKKNHLKHECETLGENGYHHYNNHYFHFGIVVSGLAAFYCSCLKSAAVLMTPEQCVNSFTTALLILHCIFIIFQLIFLLLNVNRLFSMLGCFHNIAIMHLVATNVALLFNMVFWESSKEWQEAMHLKHNSSLLWGSRELNITIHSLESDVNSANSSNHFPKHAVHVTSNCWWRVPDAEISDDILSIELCLQNSFIGLIWRTSSEILYPVMMQYYLIVTFLLCMIWESTKITHKKQYASIFMVHVQNASFCLNSVKGFCLGIIFFVTSVTVVLVYKIVGNENFDFISMIILCIIFGSAVCASIIGLVQLRHISTNVIHLNQNLFYSYQRIGLVLVYVYASLNIISSSFSDEKYSFLLSIEALLMVLHAICQYILITQISTTSVCSQTSLKSKQLISFLVLCNITMLVLESSVYWKHTEMKSQLKVYGSLVWPVIIRIIIPCLVFFRFNSAIILLETLKVSHTESSKDAF